MSISANEVMSSMTSSKSQLYRRLVSGDDSEIYFQTLHVHDRIIEIKE